ncbi:DUF2231 domain-containing protein [Aquipuribacter nitratireducens]|uniref:DUF2231 domain-containing protein n=1 Tax=Aquipuribacter nitratireducens TaxID=650104 RepID=A0ABW0GQQ7_9MICO
MTAHRSTPTSTPDDERAHRGGTPATSADAAAGTEHVPSKRPWNRLAGPYGHPFHPVVVTLPIGAFVTSLLFDLGARLELVDAVGAAFAAAWLLVIGVVGAVVAGILGGMDLATIPDGTSASRTAVTHAAVNTVATALLGFSAGIRFLQGGLDEVSDLAFGLSVAGVLVLGLGGWLGGRLAYTFGVRVARERDQDAAYRPR